MAYWSIGEVARRAAMRPSAIRYYERIGVLPVTARASGRRRYSASVLERLAVIDVAQRAGFTLGEIRTLCSGIAPRKPSPRWRAMAQRKLVEVEDLLGRVKEMKRLLELGIACGCVRLEDCELIRNESLSKRRAPKLALPRDSTVPVSRSRASRRATFGDRAEPVGLDP